MKTIKSLKFNCIKLVFTIGWTGEKEVGVNEAGIYNYMTFHITDSIA